MESNKQIVLNVLKGTFVERDVSVVDRYFSADYVQHNPAIPNGPKAIANLIPTLKKAFSYELGMVVAEGDLVMVHGRYAGWGTKPLVAVDIFRVMSGTIWRRVDEKTGPATFSEKPGVTPLSSCAFVAETASQNSPLFSFGQGQS